MKMSRTPSFRQSSNKENLFIQIANKKALSLSKKQNKIETYKYADEHYEDLIQKIELLDQENHKLRELLKKSNYLQFKFVDVAKSDLDFHSMSEVKNRSLDLSLDELKSINQGRSNDLFSAKKVQTPRQSLAAKQINIQRQRNTLINSYTQDLIQEQTSYDYLLPDETQETTNCVQEIYKDLLLNVVNKDMKIFRYMDQVIQQELKQNFQANYNNYEKQSSFLGNLIQLLTNMQNYCCGDHPDNYFIIRVYKQLKNLINQISKMFEKMKLFMIPLNNIEINQQERIQEIDRLQEQSILANSHLSQAIKLLENLTKENLQLTIQNKQYQDFLTQISYQLQVNEETSELKQNLDDIIQKCIDGIVMLQRCDNLKSQETQKLEQLDFDGSELSGKLKKISDKYDQLKSKNNRNKEKFKQCLQKIYNCFEKRIRIDGYESLTLEEQIQTICQTINQLNSKSIS